MRSKKTQILVLIKCGISATLIVRLLQENNCHNLFFSAIITATRPLILLVFASHFFCDHLSTLQWHLRLKTQSIKVSWPYLINSLMGWPESLFAFFSLLRAYFFHQKLLPYPR